QAAAGELVVDVDVPARVAPGARVENERLAGVTLAKRRLPLALVQAERMLEDVAERFAEQVGQERRLILPLAELFTPLGGQDAGELGVQSSGGFEFAQGQAEGAVRQLRADDLLVRVELQGGAGGGQRFVDLPRPHRAMK